MSEQEKPAPEIRGGNRPIDYIPEEVIFGTGASGKKYQVSGMFGHHEDDDTVDEDEGGHDMTDDA